MFPPQNVNMHLQVVDVGGGTGFCTQGIVKTVNPQNVTLLDQSDHQMAKAAKKDDLQGITLVKGDAEDLPFESDSFDRYVSAGSIEYWPEPQRGICVRPLSLTPCTTVYTSTTHYATDAIPRGPRA